MLGKAICPICAEQYSHGEVAALTCGHAFHLKCIQKWLDTCRDCPICRVKVLTKDGIVKQLFFTFDDGCETEESRKLQNLSEICKELQIALVTYEHKHAILTAKLEEKTKQIQAQEEKLIEKDNLLSLNSAKIRRYQMEQRDAISSYNVLLGQFKKQTEVYRKKYDEVYEKNCQLSIDSNRFLLNERDLLRQIRELTLSLKNKANPPVEETGTVTGISKFYYAPRSSVPLEQQRLEAEGGTPGFFARILCQSFSLMLGRATCSICTNYYMNGEVSALLCGHTFHLRCIEQWLETSRTCPSCRMSVARSNGLIDQLFFTFEDDAKLKTEAADEVLQTTESNKKALHEKDMIIKNLKSQINRLFVDKQRLEVDLELKKVAVEKHQIELINYKTASEEQNLGSLKYKQEISILLHNGRVLQKFVLELLDLFNKSFKKDEALIQARSLGDGAIEAFYRKLSEIDDDPVITWSIIRFRDKITRRVPMIPYSEPQMDALRNENERHIPHQRQCTSTSNEKLTDSQPELPSASIPTREIPPLPPSTDLRDYEVPLSRRPLVSIPFSTESPSVSLRTPIRRLSPIERVNNNEKSRIINWLSKLSLFR